MAEQMNAGFDLEQKAKKRKREELRSPDVAPPDVYYG